ncbi:MAG: ISL3 family transposase [Solirubrobacterales bacterium]|nr:ISL3 family transposase [Solirubrobacterales bacterium]
MRVRTAFNRMLRLPGAWVKDVAFSGEGVIVTVGLRRRGRVCSGCGARGLEIKDRRVKRWRHLDLGSSRCFIECELRRLRCPGCGDRPEMVEWARATSPYTRDFEDLAAWLAQQMAKSQITRLLRIGWESIGKIVVRVVADHLDEGRLDGLVWLGVDEISHGAGHRFLMCVADHEQGGVVWAAPGRNAATLQGFFDELTETQKSSIRGVSIDMSAGYEKAITAALPAAQVCFDPFHVIQLGGRATDQVRRAEWNEHGRSHTKHGTWIKGARYSLLKDPANQSDRQLATLAEVQKTNKRLYRGYLLLNELRLLYRVPRHQAPEQLQAWLAWASRSKLKPFVRLARTIRKHKAGVLAAIALELSNGRLEGLNSKIRLLSHRAYGFHSADALIAIIYLCCTNIQIALPHQ